MKTYVIKLWSNIVMSESWFNDKVICNIVEWINYCLEKKISIILVSSWAVSMWRIILNKKNWVETQNSINALASIGQAHLMKKYWDIFEKRGIHISQVLLTRACFSDKTNYKSMKQMLGEILNSWIIPLVNENDVLFHESLDFTDNDQLWALLAWMMWAERLIILSSINGFYNWDPKDGGKIIRVIENIDDSILWLVRTEKSSYWKWWMLSKLKTAKLITDLWIEMNIANGRSKDVLKKISDWKNIWTVFIPKIAKKLDNTRKWLKAWATPKWKILVSTIISDLLRNKKRTSILAIWVEKVINSFKIWDVVEVCDDNWFCLWIWISRIDDSDIFKAKEICESKIVIHTDYYIYLDEFEKSY